LLDAKRPPKESSGGREQDSKIDCEFRRMNPIEPTLPETEHLHSFLEDESTLQRNIVILFASTFLFLA